MFYTGREELRDQQISPKSPIIDLGSNLSFFFSLPIKESCHSYSLNSWRFLNIGCLKENEIQFVIGKYCFSAHFRSAIVNINVQACKWHVNHKNKFVPYTIWLYQQSGHLHIIWLKQTHYKMFVSFIVLRLVIISIAGCGLNISSNKAQ